MHIDYTCYENFFLLDSILYTIAVFFSKKWQI